MRRKWYRGFTILATLAVVVIAGNSIAQRWNWIGGPSDHLRAKFMWAQTLYTGTSPTAVTSTAAELNKLDGVTSTTAELNYLDVTAIGQSEALKAAVFDGSGVFDVAAAHELNIDGTLSIGDVNVGASAAEIDILDGATVTTAEVNQLDAGTVLKAHSQVVTIAEVNAGEVLVAPVADRTITVLEIRIIVTGGAVGTCTSVEIEDTNGTPVVAWTGAIAALTEDVVISSNVVVANVTDSTPIVLTAGAGLTITKTTGTCDTATSITVIARYIVSDA